MLQNPVADNSQGFLEKWLRHEAPAHPEKLERLMLVDPAGEKKQGSDYTVIWITGSDGRGNHYLLDGLRDRLNLTGRADAVMALHRAWRPALVGYEKYGMQSDIEHIEYIQEQLDYRFEIIPLGGSMPKNDRIRRLVPLFEQGRLHLPERLPFTDSRGRVRDLIREFIAEEYLAFPVSRHDDMLDCLSRLLDLREKGPRPFCIDPGILGKR
jgi:predicted phage terminase large subunit-like protein